MPSPVLPRFGLFLQPIHDPHHDPGVALEDDLTLIEHVDRLGFDDVWIGEHHSTGWETIASPAVFIAAAAARTRRIRLGSGVVPLPLHHPLVTAGEYALLDHLTGGRSMLGVGPGGGLPSDPLVFALEPSRQPAMFTERFDVLMRLFLEHEPFDYDGDGFALRNAVLNLRPRSAPHPEIGIVAGRSEDALVRIGRHGTRWLIGAPLDAIDEAWTHVERGASDAGRSVSRDIADLPVTVHLADDRDRAFEEVRRGAARERFDFATPVTGAPPPDVAPDDWIDHLAAQPTVVIGTPDDAIEKLTSLIDRTAVGGFLITAKWWAGREATLRSYDLLARYVMPALRRTDRDLAIAANAAAHAVARRRGER